MTDAIKAQRYDHFMQKVQEELAFIHDNYHEADNTHTLWNYVGSVQTIQTLFKNRDRTVVDECSELIRLLDTRIFGETWEAKRVA